MKKPSRETVKNTAIFVGVTGTFIATTAGAIYLNEKYFAMKSMNLKYGYLIALMHEQNPEFVEEMMAVANANVDAALAVIQT